MKTCVFAGTFDPITKGHQAVIEKSLQLFDNVIIALLENHDKTPYFTLAERKAFIEELYKDNPNVTVEYYDGMLVEFLKMKNVRINVRGLRNAADLKYELAMKDFNKSMYPDLITVFLPTDENLREISSTKLRELIREGKPFTFYVDDKIVPLIKKAAESKQK